MTTPYAARTLSCDPLPARAQAQLQAQVQAPGSGAELRHEGVGGGVRVGAAGDWSPRGASAMTPWWPPRVAEPGAHAGRAIVWISSRPGVRGDGEVAGSS